jgi:hypothetical protein
LFSHVESASFPFWASLVAHGRSLLICAVAVIVAFCKKNGEGSQLTEAYGTESVIPIVLGLSPMCTVVHPLVFD